MREFTTVASIWMTAAIGIVIGMGFYFAALAAVMLTLLTLSVLRWVERMTLSASYAQSRVHLSIGHVLAESELRALLKARGALGGRAACRLDRPGEAYSYDLRIKALGDASFERLASVLRDTPGVDGFSLRPVGD